MIVGAVLPTGEYAVLLQVRGRNGKIARVQALLDTGFSDFLTLPLGVIERLSLAPGDEARYQLADGSWAASREFLAELEWMGTWRKIIVIAIDEDPLVGRKTLEGHQVRIHAVGGGRVEIFPIAEATAHGTPVPN